MLIVSKEAAIQVKSLMQAENLGEDYFVRLSVVGGGCSGLSYKMDFDNEDKEEDEKFESEGCTLECDKKSFLYLYGTTLEYTSGLNGKGFQFNNPNASRSCGCGESFAV